jgi:hypothetical protein
MPFDPKSLMDLLPLLASVGGNAQYRDSVMHGYTTTRRQFEQEALLKQQAARQDQLAQSEIQNRQADNERADKLLQLQQGNADLGRLEHFRSAAGQQANTIAESATDPLAAQNELAAQSIGLRKDFGVPATTTMPTPNMAGMISQRKKKKAQELYQNAEKTYGPEAMANDSISIKSPEFGDPMTGVVKPSALRALFGVEAQTTTGAPATPYVKPVVPGTEKERAAQLLGKIRDAQTSGDTQTAAKLQREYDNIIKAAHDIGLADNVPRPPATVVVQTIEDGKPVTKIVPKVAGGTYERPPSAVTENRLDSAKAVVQTGNDIIGSLQDPATAALVGPAMGRYNSVREWVGNPPPELAGLAGRIESYSLANMGVHGMRSARGAQKIADLLDRKHTPQSLIEAVRGLNDFSEHFMTNAGRDVPAEPTKRIRVKRKTDGQTGTILDSDFDPAKYDKVGP